MRIPRNLLGRLVELTWRDPVGGVRHECHLPDRADLPRGRAALATWTERGVIDDITEGVIRLIQSEAVGPGKLAPDEFGCQWIPEDLVESIRAATFESEKPDDPASKS